MHINRNLFFFFKTPLQCFIRSSLHPAMNRKIMAVLSVMRPSKLKVRDSDT